MLSKLISYAYFCLTIVFCSYSVRAVAHSSEQLSSIFELSLEELLGVKVSGAGSLIESTIKDSPAIITHIRSDQIASSGARSLDELLEIFVPGLQIMIKDTADAIGIRGINSNNNDKWLMIVNNHIVNERTTTGAVSERFMSMLGDIKSIDVVRNPGSAVRGPGAIAGIVSLKTYNAQNFEGTELTARLGIRERFSTFEVKFGQQFKNDLSFFAYLGVDKYEGANNDSAPLYLSGRTTSFNDGATISTVSQGQYNWIDQNGDTHSIEAHQDLPFQYSRYHEAYFGKPRYKAHVDLHYAIDTKSSVDTWMRFTKGGQFTDPAPWSYMLSEDLRDEPSLPLGGSTIRRGYTPELNAGSGYGYKQIMWSNTYTREFSDKISFNLKLTYDELHYETDNGERISTQRENESLMTSSIDWVINQDNQLVLGASVSYNEYGEDADVELGLPSSFDKWNTKTNAIFAEHKYNITPNLTSWLSLRLDKHEASRTIKSPKISLVYRGENDAVYKVMLNRSKRFPNEKDIQGFVIVAETRGVRADINAADTISFFEVSAFAPVSKTLTLQSNFYFAEHDELGINRNTLINEFIGTSKYYGFEGELNLRARGINVSLSHNYTKLLDYKLGQNLNRINTTTEPFGYGDDFTNWSSHSTKVVLDYKFNDELTGFASLHYLWGFPGLESAADYHEEVLSNTFAIDISDPANVIDVNTPSEVDSSISNNAIVNNYSTTVTDGSNDAFKGRGYLHIGGTYHISEKSQVKLHLYNLLGLFDDDLNNRNTYWRAGMYRQEPVSLSISYSQTF